MSPERVRPAFALKAVTRGVFLLILSTVYCAYVFRLTSGDWRRAGLGDWSDPYFINSLLEQWRSSLTHLRSPISPPVFYPIRGTLGYSHSLVLYAPVYVVARLWLHPFTAHTLTLFATIEIGTLCLYVLFRKYVGLGFVESLLFVAVFATSANVINGWTGVWSQRASVFLIPPMLLLGLWSARHPGGACRWFGLAGSGLFAASLFTHDIYTGLLAAVVAALLLAGSYLILRWPRVGIHVVLWRRHCAPVSTVRRIWMGTSLLIAAVSLVLASIHQYNSLLGLRFDIHHRHPGRALVAAAIAAVTFELLRGGARDRIAIVDSAAASDAAAMAAGAMLGLAIFFWVYWDAFSLHHGFDTQELTGHLTQIDAAAWRQIWISPGAFVSYDSGRSFAMVFALGAAAWLPWLNVPARVRWCSLWFAGVTALMLAIPLRIGGVAPWRYVFEALPGFSAIRDPRRMQYPFELAIALALGVFTAQLPRSSVPRRIVVVFVLLVLSLKWNMERFDYERPLEVFRQFVDAPIAIDPSCRSFFVKAAQSHPYLSRSANPWPLYANDASFIAQKYAIPTLNGYSAWTPPDWHLFNPQDPDYLPGVVQWVSLNRLDHVCELDIERRTMSPFTARASGAFPR